MWMVQVRAFSVWPVWSYTTQPTTRLCGWCPFRNDEHPNRVMIASCCAISEKIRLVEKSGRCCRISRELCWRIASAGPHRQHRSPFNAYETSTASISALLRIRERLSTKNAIPRLSLIAARDTHSMNRTVLRGMSSISHKMTVQDIFGAAGHAQFLASSDSPCNLPSLHGLPEVTLPTCNESQSVSDSMPSPVCIARSS